MLWFGLFMLAFLMLGVCFKAWKEIEAEGRGRERWPRVTLAKIEAERRKLEAEQRKLEAMHRATRKPARGRRRREGKAE